MIKKGGRVRYGKEVKTRNIFTNIVLNQPHFFLTLVLSASIRLHPRKGIGVGKEKEKGKGNRNGKGKERKDEERQG
jgi:hypothetical protein